jgi:uroporphyrin-III C-methyltransferase/precorrin-2 dehydrogenase/sirohydrochlorin ferrochelatase
MSVCNGRSGVTMDYFPIFLRLIDQPVVVVGGGEVAARKALLLKRAGADITIVAPQLCDVLQQRLAHGELHHVAEEFRPEHLEGARLVIAATNVPAVNAWVSREAEARNIPTNVVDDRELSRFVMPAIVDRSPVIVAIGSSGDAPVLTRRLREKIEALLPPGLSKLAKLSGELRSKVKQRVSNADARRRFWERFFDGDIAADVLAGRDQQAQQAIQSVLASELSATEQAATPQGEVALVGAGPGDPGLLTLRALRVMQNADVVVYDRLVSDEVLELVRRDAQRIYVGKAAGKAYMPQEDINQLLVDLARQGKRVCRLKGGDPFVFGRGGEELELLAQHGVRFEVVPGITAAAGCAAYAGIPLTHRNHAQLLTFTTGHGHNEATATDWDMLARPGQTAVFYMGLNGLPKILRELQAHGMPSERAAAVIEQGTRSNQRVILGTIATLADQVQQAQVQSPALLIVGEVTRLHEQLRWFNTTAAQAQADSDEIGERKQ